MTGDDERFSCSRGEIDARGDAARKYRPRTSQGQLARRGMPVAALRIAEGTSPQFSSSVRAASLAYPKLTQVRKLLVPISQSILLNIYTPEQRGSGHGPVRRLGDCEILGRSGCSERYGIDIWPLIFAADFPHVSCVCLATSSGISSGNRSFGTTCRCDSKQ